MTIKLFTFPINRIRDCRRKCSVAATTFLKSFNNVVQALPDGSSISEFSRILTERWQDPGAAPDPNSRAGQIHRCNQGKVQHLSKMSTPATFFGRGWDKQSFGITIGILVTRLLIGLSFTICPHIMKSGASEQPTTKTGRRGKDLSPPSQISAQFRVPLVYGWVSGAIFCGGQSLN